MRDKGWIGWGKKDYAKERRYHGWWVLTLDSSGDPVLLFEDLSWCFSFLDEVGLLWPSSLVLPSALRTYG
jgi:hypothetical protein